MKSAHHDMANVGGMVWLHRRRDLRLRPLSDLHDEFSARPHAQSMLDDAEDELAKRGRLSVPHADQRS